MYKCITYRVIEIFFMIYWPKNVPIINNNFLRFDIIKCNKKVCTDKKLNLCNIIRINIKIHSINVYLICRCLPRFNDRRFLFQNKKSTDTYLLALILYFYIQFKKSISHYLNWYKRLKNIKHLTIRSRVTSYIPI